ncbi:hypothetical protein [Rhizobium sp. LjRoot258]|uniref:hypothetical protein n=1 Tax=Rhizobium sp. LjRoot258 TaxID=3342299 RepID=UPI003F4F9F03
MDFPFTTKGTRISDPTELERLSALTIPPAYTEVLTSADENSHLQACQARRCPVAEAPGCCAGWTRVKSFC